MNILQDLIAAGEHAAGIIYAKVLSVESDAAKWETDHPEVGPLIGQGVLLAEKVLGINDGMLEEGQRLLDFVVSGLGKLAARDSSVGPRAPTKATLDEVKNDPAPAGDLAPAST